MYSIGEVTDRICSLLGFNLAQIKRRTRKPSIVRQREVVAWCLYYIFRFGVTEIGRYFGQDHSTIIKAIKRAKPPNSAICSTLQDLASKKDAFENLEISQVDQLRAKRRKHYVAHGAKCAVCGIEDIVEVHHIVPLRSGGADSPENSILLCPNHHSMLHLGLIRIKELPKLSQSLEDEAKVLHIDFNHSHPFSHLSR